MLGAAPWQMHKVCLTYAVTRALCRELGEGVWWDKGMPIVQLEMGNLLLPLKEQQEHSSDSGIAGTGILVSLYRKLSLRESHSLNG